MKGKVHWPCYSMASCWTFQRNALKLLEPRLGHQAKVIVKEFLKTLDFYMLRFYLQPLVVAGYCRNYCGNNNSWYLELSMLQVICRKSFFSCTLRPGTSKEPYQLSPSSYRTHYILIYILRWVNPGFFLNIFGKRTLIFSHSPFHYWSVLTTRKFFSLLKNLPSGTSIHWSWSCFLDGATSPSPWSILLDRSC